MRWRIDEVIDVESLIARDRRGLVAAGGEPAVLERRDRRIGAAIAADGDPGSDQARLRAWIRRCREEIPLPGRTWLSRARLAAWLGGVLAFCAGWGLGAALLAYDGNVPINVMDVLVALVGVPALLALVALVLALPGPWRRLARLGGPVPALVARLFARLAMRPESGLRTGLLRRRDGRLLYAPVARWLAVGAVQAWAACLLAGVLLAIWWAALRSDLAFAWHSTLLSDRAMTALVTWIGAPWEGVWPAAVPDPELVAHSRYVLLEASFVPARDGARSLDPTELHRWWGFLFMAVLVWSLLPRLLFLAAARWRLAVARGRLRLDHADHRRVLARLRPEADFTAREPVAEAPDAPRDRGDGGRDDRVWPAGAQLVRWGGSSDTGEAVAAALAAAGAAPRSRATAGVDATLAADRRLLDGLAEEPTAVILAVDAREPPVEDCFAFLRELRATLGDRPLCVAVVADKDEATGPWREGLRRAGIDAAVRKVAP